MQMIQTEGNQVMRYCLHITNFLGLSPTWDTEIQSTCRKFMGFILVLGFAHFVNCEFDIDEMV